MSDSIIQMNIETSLELDVTISEGGKALPTYRGDYEVTPKITKQTLATKNKTMTNDMTIYQIPYSEVSNPSGGKTVTIGLE